MPGPGRRFLPGREQLLCVNEVEPLLARQYSQIKVIEVCILSKLDLFLLQDNEIALASLWTLLTPRPAQRLYHPSPVFRGPDGTSVGVVICGDLGVDPQGLSQGIP
jgi:hypothetical protein